MRSGLVVGQEATHQPFITSLLIRWGVQMGCEWGGEISITSDIQMTPPLW